MAGMATFILMVASRVGSDQGIVVAEVDKPGIVLGVPVMFGIPVMGSVGVVTAVVFGLGSVTPDAVATVGVTVPTVGATARVGTAAAELTPRLPISVDPIGMPVRGTPPAVTADVGIDDAARLLEPAPHMLWVPDVSISTDVGGRPEGDIDDVVDIPGIDIALCAGTVPTATPPPSKAVADPNIVDGAAPMVEHAVLPMLDETGIGLTPAEAISVAPSGMPVPPTGALGTMPSGDVAESEGVGITAACCAKAVPHSKAEAAVIIRKRFMVFLRFRSSSVTSEQAAERSGGIEKVLRTGSLLDLARLLAAARLQGDAGM
jgi:hypothetical protein